MFDVSFLNDIRKHEFDHIRAYLPENARILEIGAGTGQQSKMLADSGFDVVALDVPQSAYASDRCYQVTEYDGRHIPFPDKSFDIIFSSNVLEHVADLDGMLQECDRVLKDGGKHIHAMPTATWRWWTIVTNYPELLQRLALAVGEMVPRGLRSEEFARLIRFPFKAAWVVGAYIFPRRHGETGCALSELWTFSPRAWRGRLRRSGLKILQDHPMGLFYTGHMLLGRRLSMARRERLAPIAGSSCHLFICQARDDARDVPREASLSGKLDRLLASKGWAGRKISVAIDDGQDAAAKAEELLRHGDVVSVFVVRKSSDPATYEDPRIGALNFRTGEVVKPGKVARRLVVLVPTGEFRRRFASGLLPRGCWRLLVWNGMGWRDVSVGRYISVSVLSHIAQLTESIFGFLPSMRARLIPSAAGGGGVPFVTRLLQRLGERVYRGSFASIREAASRRKSYAPESPAGILMVNNALAQGGAERQLVMTCTALKSHGFPDVSLLCSHLGGEHEGLDLAFYLEAMESAGIPVTGLRGKRLSPIDGFAVHKEMGLFEPLEGLPVQVQEEIVSYHEVFERRRPAILHLWQDYTNVVAGVAAVLAGAPRIILSTRNVSPPHFAYFQPWMKAGYRALLAFPHVEILANSDAGAKSYAEWLGLPSERFKVVRNGFDFRFGESATESAVEEFKRKLGLPRDSRVVGSVFRFWPEKDPLLWVRTAAEISKHDRKIVFLLVGAGILQDRIQEEAKILGIFDRLFLPGPLLDVAPALRAMDLFLLTSSAEGIPNVVLEAQALGVPVALTPGGGAPEGIIDGETGVVVRERTPEALARAVHALMADSEWMAAARNQAPRFIGERFSMERMVKETIDVYSSADTHEVLRKAHIAR